MPIMFNSLLRDAGLDPADVRLLRHSASNTDPGRSPYALWRDDRPDFEKYQSKQTFENRKKFAAPYWAVFVATDHGATMFVGLYGATYLGPLEYDSPKQERSGIDKAGSCDTYHLDLQETLSEFSGKLFIEWGKGTLAWVQYPQKQNKAITELRREFSEPPFPGYQKFIRPLSQFHSIPKSWIDALRSARGVYLLTCPKTKGQYVGSATGEVGFWGRWQDYVKNGHGGNLGLKSREPSDYQVSILEVAGSSASTDDILVMEGLWQSKFQSREMGLNHNLAHSPT
jgi:hypothetical protein